MVNQFVREASESRYASDVIKQDRLQKVIIEKVLKLDARPKGSTARSSKDKGTDLNYEDQIVDDEEKQCQILRILEQNGEINITSNTIETKIDK